MEGEEGEEEEEGEEGRKDTPLSPFYLDLEVREKNGSLLVPIHTCVYIHMSEYFAIFILCHP